jgi:hypothetical protein
VDLPVLGWAALRSGRAGGGADPFSTVRRLTVLAGVVLLLQRVVCRLTV